MEQHKHGYLFREKDVDRVIHALGKKPPEELRSKIMSGLAQDKNRFIEMQRIRDRQREIKRGRTL